MAQTVKDGREVTLDFVSGAVITGYLAGMDDYYWLVFDIESNELVLVRKGAVSVVRFSNGLSYQAFAGKARLEPIIRPFRDYVLKTFFGGGGAVSAHRED